MKFARVPVAQSAGLISAHTVRAGDVVVAKGRTIAAEAARRLERAGIRDLVAARLEPGDVGEDEAAARIARRLAGAGLRLDRPGTGRCNVFAQGPGVLVIDVAAIDAVNAVDEAITVATLPAFRAVVADEMVATVKIIPYAVAAGPMERACGALGLPPLRLAPWSVRRVGVVSTLLPGLKPATVAKTLRALADRLAPTGAAIVADVRVAHAAGAVADALAGMAGSVDLAVVFGASAVADRRDVIPAGIEAAGGRIEHFGMPVDPGNLLLVGSLGALPVIGAPGCARSPKENGFDWILHRLLAGLPVTRADIVRLGVGGLLMEIVSRPQPRAEIGRDAPPLPGTGAS